MTPEHWQRIKALLESALERKPNERSVFLNQTCAGDSSLRNEVESLIASHEQASRFIEEPAYGVMARVSTAKRLRPSAQRCRLAATLGIASICEVRGYAA